MDTRRLYWSSILIGLFVLILVLTSGCGEITAVGRFLIWLDVPIDGVTVLPGEPVFIEGHATHPGGILKVEIWIDGNLLITIKNPPAVDNLASFSQEWTPPGEGEYTIQVVAFGKDGSASQPDTARITVSKQLAQEIPAQAPSHTPTPFPAEEKPPTETPTPQADAPVVEFWAEPAEAQAGACPKVFWHVENVDSIEFGGREQNFDGYYEECLCKSETFTLTVNYLDGSQQKHRVNININGTCGGGDDSGGESGSSSSVDTTPPPAPSLTKPVNGTTFGSCVSSTTLMWNAVSDPSGISKYQIQAQRHSGDNNWSAAPGSPWNSSSTSTSISIECGWTYRWRVRAVDGAGNPGSWSGWFTFIDLLT